MIRKLTIWPAAVLAIATSSAADDLDCRHAMVQRDLNICASRDYDAADRRLNETYHRAMALMTDEASRGKLVSAERAWMAYRDGQCRLETAEEEGGSLHPMMEAICLTKLTEARRRELERYLACQRDSAKC